MGSVYGRLREVANGGGEEVSSFQFLVIRLWLLRDKSVGVFAGETRPHRFAKCGGQAVRSGAGIYRGEDVTGQRGGLITDLSSEALARRRISGRSTRS